MPCHHKLEAYLDAYIEAAGIEGDRKGPLFRAAIGKTKKLGPGAISRTDVWYMVRRRASDAGIETAIGCHTFRATGITDYLTNGGRIEVAQRMAGHSNAKTTGLYATAAAGGAPGLVTSLFRVIRSAKHNARCPSTLLEHHCWTVHGI
jgi:integrase/recombinase XerD